MKNSIFLALLGILLFSAPCNATPTPTTKQASSEIAAELISVSFWGFDAQRLLYISLGSSTLAIVLVIILMMLVVKTRSQASKRYIMGQKQEPHNGSNGTYNPRNDNKKPDSRSMIFTKQDMELIAQELIDKNNEKITMKSLEYGNGGIKETQQESEDQNCKNICPDHESAKISYLYASSADRNNNTFFKVTQQPDEDTIYKFSTTGNNADFKVHEAAFKRVLIAPDCLECACEVSKSGSRSVVTKKQGVAERQSDGTWRIISKAEIKFE